MYVWNLLPTLHKYISSLWRWQHSELSRVGSAKLPRASVKEQVVGRIHPVATTAIKCLTLLVRVIGWPHHHQVWGAYQWRKVSLNSKTFRMCLHKGPWPTSQRHCEWALCGCWQCASGLLIHQGSSKILAASSTGMEEISQFAMCQLTFEFFSWQVTLHFIFWSLK